MEKFKNELSVRRSYIMNDIQTRNLQDEEQGRIEGHAAVFNQTADIGGFFDEIIERGAFDGCDFSDVALFVNHEQDELPLARSKSSNGASTMQLRVDEVGLFISADIDLINNANARSLYSAIKRGDIDGMSFAFRIKEQKWENLDSEKPTRRITKIAKVYEVSAVNNPAYESTEISARDKSALEEARKALDSARGGGSDAENEELELERAKLKLKLKLREEY
ncbi:HK97 family phage prohead protease [Clostridium baratii]|uniref:HK97 family phage prohead protease n=1 Tax=Clostridium baratii TaxID=1561 RepID=UPI0030D3CA41